MELDFVSILTEHFEIIVMIASLIVGYAIKHGSIFKKIPNDDIPIILLVFAAVLNGFVSGWTIESIVYGALIGLSSTGLHQSFKKFITNNQEGA